MLSVVDSKCPGEVNIRYLALERLSNVLFRLGCKFLTGHEPRVDNSAPRSVEQEGGGVEGFRGVDRLHPLEHVVFAVGQEEMVGVVEGGDLENMAVEGGREGEERRNDFCSFFTRIQNTPYFFPLLESSTVQSLKSR